MPAYRTHTIRHHALARPHRLLGAALAVALVALIARLATETAGPPDFDAACEDGEPWYVGSLYLAQIAAGGPPSTSGPSALLFRDTPTDGPHYRLATLGQTGALWGIGYHRTERALYAGAYHKASIEHGPEGTGAVYRIDLTTGEVRHAFDVPDSGEDRHDLILSHGGKMPFDPIALEWVGQTSLGDLEIDEATSTLFIVNLYDRRIHRYSLPDAAPLGPIENGAAAERWAESARPFGLAIHDGMLYHVVVNSAGVGPSLAAVVYRSGFDGAGMEEVARVRLDYMRSSVRVRVPEPSDVDIQWGRWLFPGKGGMPMSTDLEFTSDGNLVLGLRDRRTDFYPVCYSAYDCMPMGFGFGDLLLGCPSASGWSFDPLPDHFDDRNALFYPESALGGLAFMPVHGATTPGTIVAPASGVGRDSLYGSTGIDGVYWFDVATGEKRSSEVIAHPERFLPFDDLLAAPLAMAHTGGDYHQGSLGDIETLCSSLPPTPTPTSTATHTPTRTPTTDPSATITSSPTWTPSPTPTPVPQPIFLPISLTERCTPDRVRADVALVLDASTSMTGEKLEAAKAAAVAFIESMRLPEDRVGVAAFNRDARIVHALSGDAAALVAAIEAIDVAAGTRIDRGLEAGLEVLADARSGGGVTPVLVLLTDGIQEAEPEAPPAVAERIRAAGIVLHVVGLGADVDADYLRDVAGAADRLHLSPGTAELGAIYTGIARSIPCPAEAF